MRPTVHTGAKNLFQKFLEVLRGNKSPEVLAAERWQRAQQRRMRYSLRNASYPYSSKRQLGRGGYNHSSILAPRRINPQHWTGKVWGALA